MQNKRLQLTLDELPRLKWLQGGALALFSAWTVFYLEVEAWALLLLNTGAIIAVLVWPKLPEFVPGWVHKAAFPVIVVVFLADVWLSAQGQVLPPMIRLDLMLILYRAISYRQRRDDLQLILLGLFLVVVAGVLTVSLAFAVQIIAFTACALLLLFVITLVDAAEAQDPPVRTPWFTWRIATVAPSWTQHGDWPRLFVRLRAVTDWRVALLGAVLFAGVVVVSGLLFLAIPRFQFENSLFLERFISKKSKTGFTDSIKFGDVTDIINDTSLALSVDVSDSHNVPVPLYLRMVVLDEYKDGAFRLSPELRRAAFERRERNTTEIRGKERHRLNDPIWVFYFEAGVSRYLPLPGSFELLRFQQLQNVSVSLELRAIALRNEPVTMTAYRLEGVNISPLLPDDDFAANHSKVLQVDDGRVKPPLRATQLALPNAVADQAALRRVVAEIVGAPPDDPRRRGQAAPLLLAPADFARRACQWLAARHAYSLQSTLPPGFGDPLVRWINSNEPGHCELYAGAFVVLARAAGLPARLISGFKASTWNAISNNLTVRNSDAHAWCEVWNGAGAWLRVDPLGGATPVGSADEPRGEAAIAQHSDRSWKARLDSLRVFWYRRIVNFDQRSQLDTLRAMKSTTQETGTRLRAALERKMEALKRWLQSPWDVRRVMTLLVAAFALGIAGWAIRVLARTWRWRFSGPGGRVDPVRAAAGRWLGRLRTQGSGTPRRLAPPLILKGSDAAVLADLERLRYGPRSTWPEPEAVFRRARKVWRKARQGGVLR